MSEQDKNKRLDELISRAIDSGKVQFDTEKWKQKYPEESGLLASRRKTGSEGQVSIWQLIYKSRIARFAVAAAIIITVGFFVAHHGPGQQIDVLDTPEVAKSAVELMTLASLNRAYRRGGMEQVINQCEKAREMLGPRPANMPAWQLFSEFDSENSERIKL